MSGRLTAFDGTTGQVYTQTSVVVPSMKRLPIDFSTGRREDPQKYRHPQGAAPLHELCIRQCAWHIDSFRVDDLKDRVEWLQICPVYNRLVQTDSLGFEQWALFRGAYPDEECISSHFSIRAPPDSGERPFYAPITTLVEHLKVLPFSYLIFVSIKGQHLETALSKALLYVPGLVALEIAGRCSPKKDTRPLRNWCREAGEGQLLQKLRLLMLSGLDLDVSPNNNPLNQFTELQYVMVAPYNSSAPLDFFGRVDMGPSWRLLPWKSRVLESDVLTPQTGSRDSTKKNAVGPQTPVHGAEEVNMRSSPTLKDGCHPLYEVHDRTDISTSVRLLELYKCALADAGKDPLTSSDTTISASYRARDYNCPYFQSLAAGTSMRGSCARWYVRNSRPQPSESRGVKRTSSPGDRLSPSAPTTKMRKVNKGKQQDIGSMLGQFS